jgi:proteasome lid subunit RPN8/RPN11
VDPEGDSVKGKDEHAKLANIKKYTHPDDAAVEALRTVWDRSVRDGVEYSGWIYRNPDGSYSFGEGGPGLSSIKSTLPPIPEGAVAWYHTHPDTPVFSTGDDATLLFWWRFCKRNNIDPRVSCMYLSADGNSVITRSIVDILSGHKPEHRFRVVR